MSKNQALNQDTVIYIDEEGYTGEDLAKKTEIEEVPVKKATRPKKRAVRKSLWKMLKETIARRIRKIVRKRLMSKGKKALHSLLSRESAQEDFCGNLWQKVAFYNQSAYCHQFPGAYMNMCVVDPRHPRLCMSCGRCKGSDFTEQISQFISQTEGVEEVPVKKSRDIHNLYM